MRTREQTLFFEWEPRFVPSPLCLKDKGEGKAEVVRVTPGALLGQRLCRLYDAWVSGRCVYRAADEFRVGQFVRG